MIKEFESLVTSYLDTQVGQCSFFLNPALADQLRINLLALYGKNQFHKAGISQKAAFNLDHSIRSDLIYWLDKKHNDPSENAFLDLIDQYVIFLNSTCYAGIIGYEFHYALYETGSYYKRHTDQFKTNQGRAFSMIIYLNPDWHAQDGGQLCIYLNDQTLIINPENQSCIFFKSKEIQHEVLPSHRPRLSITGWLKTV